MSHERLDRARLWLQTDQYMDHFANHTFSSLDDVEAALTNAFAYEQCHLGEVEEVA